MSSFVDYDTLDSANESFSLYSSSYDYFTPVPSNSLEYALHALKCLIGIVGAIGNGFVCVIIWKVRREQNFINELIVSQSAIDFFTSLLLIAQVISTSVDAQPPDNFALAVLFCKFWYSRGILFSCWAISTFNLVAIGLERYLAVIHPIWYHKNFTRKHARILAITAWFMGPIMQTIFSATISSIEDGQSQVDLNPGDHIILGILLFLWNFFLPLCIMAFAFIRIIVRLHQMKKTPSETRDEDEMRKNIMRRKNVTKTLAIVFLLFAVCVTPEQITFLQFNLGGKLDFGGWWHTITLSLSTSNSAVNPFVYALRFKQYKEGLRSLYVKMKEWRK